MEEKKKSKMQGANVGGAVVGMREGSEQVGAGFIFSLQLFCRARYFSATESAMVLTPPDLANG